MNERGQGLSTNAIVLIILGVFILAILIFGFTLGWGKIAPWISTSNVDTIVNSCAVACNTRSQYDFCTAPRELKADGVELKDVTCNYLAEKQKKYGIDSCGSVSCVGTTRLLDESGFENQAAFDIAVGDDKDEGVCDVVENKGKTVYVLNNNGDTLLSAECKAAL